MKTKTKLLALLLAAAALLCIISGFAAQKRFALVIGMTKINDHDYLKNYHKQYDHDAVSA